MKETLLQKLAMEAGFSYMSDLHSQYHAKCVYYALDRLTPGEYPLEEWEEAVRYITGLKETHFHSQEEAFHYLKDKCGSVRTDKYLSNGTPS